MQVGALNCGLWLNLRRMIVVHDCCPGGIQKEIQGIFGRGSGEMRRDSEGGAGEIRHGSLSIKVLHAYVN